jgi:hypothetical protein
MPAAGAAKLRPAPNEVLLDVLTDLLQRPAQAELAYLLALLLVRRRALVDDQSSVSEVTQAGRNETWQLTHPGDGRVWLIPVAPPSSAAHWAQLQESLTRLLFTDQ